jgi:hypothetical protein
MQSNGLRNPLIQRNEREVLGMAREMENIG